MITENITLGAGARYPLKGLLTLPAQTAHPVPAVVFVHGSGPSNMDEKVGKLTPFKDLAEGLARHGIAAVRYNKRSFSHGLKMILDKSTPLTVREETIEDALLATHLLRSDARIDPDKIFIIGHSMGGMLAPRIDAAGGQYRGLILMAGTPRRLEEILLEQNAELLSTLKGFPRRIVEKQVRKLAGQFEGMYDLSDEAAKKQKVAGGTTLYYFKETGSYPIEEVLTKLRKPVLVLQGEKDVQVKADRDFTAYQQLLADNPQAVFKLYAGLNHAFVPALYDSIAQARREFAVERHIGENVIADIADWIHTVSRT